MVPARRGSVSHAWRSARAKALNVASTMWWLFLPASCRWASAWNGAGVRSAAGLAPPTAAAWPRTPPPVRRHPARAPGGCAASCRWCWPGSGKSAPPAASRRCQCAQWAAPGRSCGGGEVARERGGAARGGAPGGGRRGPWPAPACAHATRAFPSSTRPPEVRPPRKVQHRTAQSMQLPCATPNEADQAFPTRLT